MSPLVLSLPSPNFRGRPSEGHGSAPWVKVDNRFQFLSTFLLAQKNFGGCYFPSCKCRRREIWHLLAREEQELKEAGTFSLKETKAFGEAEDVLCWASLCTSWPLGLWQNHVTFRSYLPGFSSTFNIFPVLPASPLASVKPNKSSGDLFAWLTRIFGASWPLWTRV